MSGAGRSILPLVDNFRLGSSRRSCMPAAIGKGQRERYLVLTTGRCRDGIPSVGSHAVLAIPAEQIHKARTRAQAHSLQMRTNPHGLTRLSPASVPGRVQTDGSLAISCRRRRALSISATTFDSVACWLPAISFRSLQKCRPGKRL